MATIRRTLFPNPNSLLHFRSLAVAAGGKGKKSGKSTDAPKETLSKELKATTVFGANILKEGSDPKLREESEYPAWLWGLVERKAPLSELRRRQVEGLEFEELKRFVKLDNRARIKENNAVRAKN